MHAWIRFQYRLANITFEISLARNQTNSVGTLLSHDKTHAMQQIPVVLFCFHMAVIYEPNLKNYTC